MFNKAKRKKIEEHLFNFIGKISDQYNLAIYKSRFQDMSDEEFTKFMDDLEHNGINLAVVQPTGKKNTVTVKKCMDLADEMGIKLLDKVIYKTDTPYIPNLETSVLRWPIKRTVQILSSKIGVPKDNKTIDSTTGQAVGKSKGAKITIPELQLLDALGLEKTLIEFMKTRGGDQGAYRAYTASLENYGSASQEIINKHATGVVSNKTLESIYNAMLLDINLTQ